MFLHLQVFIHFDLKQVLHFPRCTWANLNRCRSGRNSTVVCNKTDHLTGHDSTIRTSAIWTYSNTRSFSYIGFSQNGKLFPLEIMERTDCYGKDKEATYSPSKVSQFGMSPVSIMCSLTSLARAELSFWSSVALQRQMARVLTDRAKGAALNHSVSVSNKDSAVFLLFYFFLLQLHTLNQSTQSQELRFTAACLDVTVPAAGNWRFTLEFTLPFRGFLTPVNICRQSEAIFGADLRWRIK